MKTNICNNIINLFEKGNKNILGYKVDKTWKKIDNNKLSYMVNSCNEILKDNNIQKGDRIVYCGDNSPEWLAWNISCYSMGGIWVPIYTNQSSEYCNYIVDDCKSKLFISNDAKTFIKNTRTITNDIHSSNTHFTINDTNDLATLIYTSGTTGNPKGVKLSHNNIVSNINAIENRFPDLKNYKTLNILPWAHIYSLTCELYYNLLNENETFICNNKNEFIDDCKVVRPQTLFLVPKILELVKKKVEFLDKPLIKMALPYVLNKLFGNELNLIFMGGAKLDDDVKQFYENNGILICEGYGCTETSPIISVNHSIFPRNTNSVGKILDNIDVKIIDKEICVSGPSIMEGYWNNPDKTDEKIFIDNNSKKWYKTGDSGFVDDGFLYYSGRISENYKLNNGKFVNVNEMEEIIKKYVSGNFIVFSETGKTNSIITDVDINENTLQLINQNFSNYLKITDVICITENELAQHLTPKLSIKRNALIKYVKNTYTK